MSFTFSKHEKLKSRKVIDQLFSEGKSITKFPVKLFYIPLDEAHSEHLQKAISSQTAFAVPKRNFKLAVTRNRVKRQMREAYRLHKHLLSPDTGKNFAFLFLYISKDKPQYEALDSSIKALLKQIKS
jgi:ribonuclease P protein component|tara:strand:+ start:534 stop:914 length:381 start_codon:yes stop_codon:yes gene_type:complete